MVVIVSGIIINIVDSEYQTVRTAGAGSKETPLPRQVLTLHLLNYREGPKTAKALAGRVGVGGMTAIIYQSVESF